MHWREQGDRGELSAAKWFTDHGHRVYWPLGHSADCDLIVDMDGQLRRVQVKTGTYQHGGRFHLRLCTSGGNQSWSGLVKRFANTRCDLLFALVGDGRRWLIPAEAVEGGNAIMLGGPKYARFEVETDYPLPARETG